MKTNVLIGLSILWNLMSTTSIDAQPSSDLSHLSFGKQFNHYSKILDENRTVNIYLPEYYEVSSPDHTYPVILLNDEHGDRFFLTTAGVVRHLSYVERMPEAIVVSFHDTSGHLPDVYNNGMWGSQEQLTFETNPAAYIRYLEEEFFPYLEKNFRANNYRIHVGVSGSAIFPLHTLVNAPELFDAHFILAAGDVIGMGYTAGGTFTDAITKMLGDNAGFRHQLYFGVADNDLAWQEEYPKNVQELKQRLAPFASDAFKYYIDIIPNEGHYDSYIKALLAGFEWVFPKQQWSPKYRDIVKQKGNALANIDAYYDSLSAAYGFTILPKANRWNNVNCLRYIGSRFLIEDRPKQALEVLKRWVDYRPHAPEAMMQLAKGYQANERINQAIATQEKAIELARQYDIEVLQTHEDFLATLKKLQ